jgi:hypothetical protein
MATGGALALLVVWFLWTRRPKMLSWFFDAPRGARLMFIGVNVAVLLAAVGSAGFGFNYMMHDNDFCKGCHIFVPSGQAWVKPDTGNYLLVNALEGKHDTLSCHSCHPFEIRAQTKEMLMWIAARPEDVPPHGRVPQEICAKCHVQDDPNHTWQRIATTAGHAIHLARDTTPTGGRIQCLTCHARSAHRFVAQDTTCAMSGCHETNTIKLGRMAAQTNMHCTLCHQFNAEPGIHASTDSAKQVLIPGERQCLACHGMQQLTAAFDFSKDPHKAQCGTCHNPHNQTVARDADKQCAECHKDWRDVAFHTGAVHSGVVRPTACTQCHQPHAARVDASDCTLNYRLYFNAPVDAYASNAKTRNVYLFRSRIDFGDGKSARIPIFANRAATLRRCTVSPARWLQMKPSRTSFSACRPSGLPAPPWISRFSSVTSWITSVE